MSSETTVMATATDANQQRIDERLDQIDRALIGLLPRSERLAIIDQIETQAREAACEVPPLGDDAVIASATNSPSGRPTGRRRRSQLAYSSGVLGIIAAASLFCAPIVYLLLAVVGELMGETVAIGVLSVHALVMTLTGLLAVAFGILSFFLLAGRGKSLTGHGWAVTGLCTGTIPMLIGGLAVLFTIASLSEMELGFVSTSSPATCAPAPTAIYTNVPVSMAVPCMPAPMPADGPITYGSTPMAIPVATTQSLPVMLPAPMLPPAASAPVPTIPSITPLPAEPALNEATKAEPATGNPTNNEAKSEPSQQSESAAKAEPEAKAEPATKPEAESKPASITSAD